MIRKKRIVRKKPLKRPSKPRKSKKWGEKSPFRKDPNRKKLHKKLREYGRAKGSYINTAIKYFNEYIRLRDMGKPCISCGRMLPLQAGHYLPAGKYPTLRFNEDNVHGQCAECNIGKYGNIEHYRNSLIVRIGYDRVRMLEMEAENYKKENGIKFSVEDYAYIAKKYKEKIKNRDYEKDNS